METESSSASPLGVFAILPLELRQQIWTYLLPRAVLAGRHPFYFRSNRDTANSLHINRTIYQEASTIQYSLSSVHFLVDQQTIWRSPNVKMHHSILGTYDMECERCWAPLAKIPWHRFNNIRIFVSQPRDLCDAVIFMRRLKQIRALLLRKSPSSSGQATPLTLQLSGKAWKNSFPPPKTTSAHVTKLCFKMYRRPVTIALAGICQLIYDDRFVTFVECDAQRTIISGLQNLEMLKMLEYRTIVPHKFHVQPPKDESFRDFARNVSAAHEYFLDYLVGDKAKETREVRKAHWRPINETECLWNIIGVPRAADFGPALARRYLFHLLLGEDAEFEALGSKDERSLAFRREWPDEKLACHVRLSDGRRRFQHSSAICAHTRHSFFEPSCKRFLALAKEQVDEGQNVPNEMMKWHTCNSKYRE